MRNWAHSWVIFHFIDIVYYRPVLPQPHNPASFRLFLVLLLLTCMWSNFNPPLRSNAAPRVCVGGEETTVLKAGPGIQTCKLPFGRTLVFHYTVNSKTVSCPLNVGFSSSLAVDIFGSPTKKSQLEINGSTFCYLQVCLLVFQCFHHVVFNTVAVILVVFCPVL